MTSKPKTLLVTGAAGFIGSHLVEMLLHKGRVVVGVDVFNDYYDPTTKERNLARAMDDESFHLVRGDIRDSDILERVFSDWDVEAVVHLAAMVGIRNSMTNPLLYADINVRGTANLLDITCKHGIGRFVLASSSSVYGNREDSPFKESDLSDSPCSVYAATKKAGEVLTHAYHSLYGITASCLRFFTVYGPRGRPDQAPFKFIERISRGRPIQQYGKGDSSRDYTYVSDIVSGIISAIDTAYEYEVFNLGNSTPVQLKRFIRTVEDLLGKKAIIEVLPDQPGDVFQTLADISKSKSMLRYEPSVPLEEGLKQTIQWYKSVYLDQ